MADIDEDAALSSFQAQPNDENDIGDELPDFRLLASLAKSGGRIPKRGEKDFESHGTKHQVEVLDASRQAMHDALSYTRIHTPKHHNRAFYYGVEGLWRDDVIPAEWRQGLEDDHVVLVESQKGPHWHSMGKMTTGKKTGCTWLLPEEALFLVERGSLDLWWPSEASYKGIPEVENDAREEKDEGYPMSLQAAYSLLIGIDEEQGKVSLQRFTIYTNLKRIGYSVMRAPDWNPKIPSQKQTVAVVKVTSPEESTSIFTWLFGKFFAEQKIEHSAYGPLVKPGMFRTYDSIYRQIAVIPRYNSSAVPPESAPLPEEPFRVVFWLWKASKIKEFKKSDPGFPDYRLAIVDARSSSVPTLTQVSSLIESTPWSPPGENMREPGQVNQRLKHGYRNVVVAVVDEGVTSYLQLGEAGFAEEKLYERFDNGGDRGTKRGGGAGRGRGRGRGKGGRGRGRGDGP